MSTKFIDMIPVYHLIKKEKKNKYPISRKKIKFYNISSSHVNKSKINEKKKRRRKMNKTRDTYKMWNKIQRKVNAFMKHVHPWKISQASLE